jgi:hypothetical protein
MADWRGADLLCSSAPIFCYYVRTCVARRSHMSGPLGEISDILHGSRDGLRSAALPVRDRFRDDLDAVATTLAYVRRVGPPRNCYC